ncbi:hypothetical protein SOVF_158150 [Spinacia oleracea]|uniref:Zinc finger protein At1g68190 n=1 Tax=Spinacia oleracea TaxID=3562 RepID=A0A9R0JSI5_SPIOL|nr:putative zinc finger protein At1g68190 [Spinacia oleracea]XP_056696537.1 putative zinc finger protein At1g68190 [Spinacia oleracea]KNA08945.1 hypothetical protein SOVF_158150 [Spinacia oleracea]
MEKTCEFCGAAWAVVYCEADAALLCLSCDTKVHSANALFARHSRTLLCDSCKQKPVYVRCLDHFMLLCQDCDKSFPHHNNLIIRSFTGCPSANQFAALSGFDVLHQFSTATSFITSDTATGFCTQQHKKLSNHQRMQNNGLIINQILELKNLQLTQGDNQTKSLHNNGEYVTPSSMHTTSVNERLKQQWKELNCLTNELQSLDNSSHLPTSSSSSSSYVGDSFWQYNKSPIDNNINQFWMQNLQDIGMCQELGCIDDFNMPDVDITFRNIEDFLIGDPDLTRALVEDNDPMTSDTDKTSMNNLEKCLIETTQDITDASLISTNKHANFIKEVNPLDNVTHQLSRNVENSSHLFRYSRSATFSCSRLSAERCGSDFLDSGNSGNFTTSEYSDNVAELHGIEVEGGESSTRLSKEKNNSRMDGKKTQLAPRKARTDLHKRNKSQYAKVQGYESDTATVTKTY